MRYPHAETEEQKILKELPFVTFDHLMQLTIRYMDRTAQEQIQ
jgi:hypothetical protein